MGQQKTPHNARLPYGWSGPIRVFITPLCRFPRPPTPLQYRALLGGGGAALPGLEDLDKHICMYIEFVIVYTSIMYTYIYIYIHIYIEREREDLDQHVPLLPPLALAVVPTPRRRLLDSALPSSTRHSFVSHGSWNPAPSNHRAISISQHAVTIRERTYQCTTKA